MRGGDWPPAVMEEFFAPEYRRHLSPGWVITAEENRARAARLRRGFPDAEVALEDIVAEGDRVAYRLTVRGTHTGEFLGMAPTGKRIAVSFLAIVRIAHGQLVEEWGGLDVGDLRRQLELGAPTWPPDAPTLGPPRRSRGGPR